MKQLRCNHCDKLMIELRAGKFIPDVVVYCQTCNNRLSAAAVNSLKGGRNNMPDFMRKVFMDGDR